MRSIAKLIERGWPLVIGLLVVAVAYFQARGLSHLVAAEIQPRAAAAQTRVGRPTRRPPLKPVSGKPVLARNPFDAETGSLLQDGSNHEDRPVEAPPEEAPPPETPQVGEARPKCDFAQVHLIIDGPKDYGFAAIRDRGGDRKMVELGDVVDEQRLFRIDADRLWFEEKGKSCQMELGEKVARKRRSRRRVRRRSRRRRRRSRVPKGIRDKIEKVSATEYRIERSALDTFMKDQASLMRGSRVRPVRRGGELIGLRMRVRRGTLFDLIGLKSGDVLKGINGFPLTNPQKALEAYGRLQSADELHLSIERKGKPVTIDFDVQ